MANPTTALTISTIVDVLFKYEREWIIAYNLLSYS
jgi:hypothetical protein